MYTVELYKADARKRSGERLVKKVIIALIARAFLQRSMTHSILPAKVIATRFTRPL